MSVPPLESNQLYYPISCDMGVKVPMRDGTLLSTDIYRPQQQNKVPVVLVRTPYNKNDESEVEAAIYFATRGYAAVVQDCRGRYDSDGEWEPFVNEPTDSYDTQTWCGTQPWSNGKVGTRGASYVALTQIISAPLRNPYLKAMAPNVGFSNLYHNWVYTGGAFQLAFNLRWGAVQMSARTDQVRYLWMPREQHFEQLFQQLPLNNTGLNTDQRYDFYQEWIRQSAYGPYWESLGNVEKDYSQFDVPSYGLGGWYDVFLQGTLNNIMGVKEHGYSETARRAQKVLIGPWTHNTGDHGSERCTGEMDFGPEVLCDLRAEECRWYDYWLKGIDNGIAEEPPVRVFVMGTNRWKTADDWPIPGTRFLSYFLHSAGNAASNRGDGSLDTTPARTEPHDSFLYDPADPVPTVGGSTCCSEDVTPVSMGPRDQRPVQWRADVLVYTSSPLTSALEVAGPIKVVLWAASSAPDTDFTAKLVDVYPDGRAINIAQGIIRARYRNSFSEPALMTPGTIYKFEIDCWSSANCFLPGHCIRVEISSSNFPQFDRNPNTGHDFGVDDKLEVAIQKVFHDAERPTQIVLPVIN